MFHSSDSQLIDKALSGSQRSWSKLVKRYQSEIYNHALRMTKQPNDAQDLMQEIFLAVFRNLPSFRGDAKFRTWLYRIASNRSIDYLRRKKPPETDSELDNLENPIIGTDLSRMREQQNEIILTMMSRLTAEHRCILELKFFQQFTFDEIGSQLGISPNTAKTRFYQSLSKMKLIAEDHHVKEALV